MFSILGTTFGGDGRTTFGLPDLRGRTAVHAGHGPGLSDRRLGAKLGREQVTLNITNLPNHNHSDQVNCDGTGATSDLPGGHYFGVSSGELDGKEAIPVSAYASASSLSIPSGDTTSSGGNQPTQLMQPWLAIHYIIALQGIFPSRS